MCLFQYGILGVEIPESNFLRAVIFPLFQNHRKTGYLYNITFIFDRCRCSWAADTPGKYERN